MMRKLLGILFIFLYTVALLKPVNPILEYAINKEYISEFLCINTDKPELDCEGKCYMTEKLSETSNGSEESEEIPDINLREFPIGFVYFYYLEDLIPSTNKKINPYANLYSFITYSNLLRPPQI